MNILQRQLPMAWLLAWLSAGLLGGVGYAWFTFEAWLWWPGWLFFVLSLAIITYKKPAWMSASSWLLAGFLLGGCRGTIELQAFWPYQQFLYKKVVLMGSIQEDPVVNKGQLKLVLQDITIQQRPLRGKLWASVSEELELKRGDQLQVQGLLSPGFGAFQGAMYRAKTLAVQRSPNVTLHIRDTFAQAIRQSIPEPQASLGVGFLLGQQSSLSPELREQLQIVGLTHIVVASGYNLTILALLARRFLQQISKYLATLVSSALMAGFITMTGFSPSMVRAGLVSGLGLAAWYYGRKVQPIVLLLVAAAITVIINPSYLWGDLGWYLSFLAFAGVLWVAPQMQSLLWHDKKLGIGASILLETSCAQLVTLPLILYAFGELAMFALPANMVVLPFVPLAMGLTFVAGLANLMGLTIGLPATWLLQYMITVIEWFAQFPVARIEVDFSLAALIGSYITLLVLATFVGFYNRRTKMNVDKTKEANLPSQSCEK